MPPAGVEVGMMSEHCLSKVVGGSVKQICPQQVSLRSSSSQFFLKKTIRARTVMCERSSLIPQQPCTLNPDHHHS